MKSLLFVTIAIFSLVACGSDDSKGDSNVPDPAAAPTGTETSSIAQGETGPKGDRGEKGERGEKGDAGPVGPAGRDGKDAETVPVNQWTDSLTGKIWFILPEQGWTANGCGLYRWPTLAEMQAAIAHGIFLAANELDGMSADSAWTGDPGATGHIAILPGITGNAADSQIIGAFCVKN